MKRKPTRKIEIFSEFPFFVWHLCANCIQEFRRMKEWRRLTGPYYGGYGHWQYLCSDCAPTETDAQRIFEAIDNKPRQRPPPPAPPPDRLVKEGGRVRRVQPPLRHPKIKIKGELNIVADTPTVNRNIFPRAVLEKAIAGLKTRPIFLHRLISERDVIPERDVNLEEVIGSIKKMEINEEGRVSFEAEVDGERLPAEGFPNKYEYAMSGYGSTQKGVINDDFELKSISVVPSREGH